MKVDVKVPGVGESITEGTLASWAVADGAAVIEGQALFEMETDKTTIDVTAPATGVLAISVAEGSDVIIAQVVGIIDTEATPVSTEDMVVADRISETSGEQRITPAARAAATDSGIDSSELSGTGRNGMITREDVLTASDMPASTEMVPESTLVIENRKASDESRQKSNETRKPLSRIRKVIAANLAKTRDELILLTTFNEVDMSSVKAMRSRYGETFRERHGVKLGFMSFFLKAAAAAMESFPEVNARIEGDEVVYPDGVHISVAVSTARGLVTPVLRHVEKMGFAGIEKQIVSFSQKAAGKTLLPDDLVGGSFTITNGGIFGSLMSTPLPAPKQSAILGMHAINDRPVALDGEIVIRPMMYLALSYDHRLIDGREAVGFLKTIKESLEHPERLLLEL